MRHYYRVKEKSWMGKNIGHLLSECQEVDRKTKQYVKNMGADDYYAKAGTFEGGIAYLIFSEDKKPDERIWRYVSHIGSDVCYEPNCSMVISAAVMSDDKFRPSNTFDTVFDKKPSTFSEVFGLNPLSHWASIAHYQLHGVSGMRDDLNYLQHYFVKTKFLKYMKFSPSPKNGKPTKMTDVVRRAIRAERERYALPVITMQRVLITLMADMSGVEKKQLEFTPMFFPHDGYYYICMQFKCTDAEAEQINGDAFTVAVNNHKRMCNC